jgi:hypothetical protein
MSRVALVIVLRDAWHLVRSIARRATTMDLIALAIIGLTLVACEHHARAGHTYQAGVCLGLAVYVASCFLGGGRRRRR